LVTWNIKDFPRKPLLKKGIVRYTPDELAVKLVKQQGWSPQVLLDETLNRIQHYQKAFPLQKPTEFAMRSQPWPNEPEQWVDFLHRNRLYLFEKLLTGSRSTQ
ncbi:MAG: hypothetical protein R3194_06600, partial [Limnobacter sp.]|nr:hypothetical protein [Limnobacter sp.]